MNRVATVAAVAALALTAACGGAGGGGDGGGNGGATTSSPGCTLASTAVSRAWVAPAVTVISWPGS